MLLSMRYGRRSAPRNHLLVGLLAGCWWLAVWPVDSLAGRFAGWLAGWLACWLAGRLLAGRLVGWLAGWLLAGWLVGLRVGWLVDFLVS